ncbi:DUF2321 domain-containing protein [Macrococcus bovicus]|nr:DUF2321 domain-containing protein [Macrococcus bovicus]
MGYYRGATICLNGHVVSNWDKNYQKHCKECGSQTISSCTNCDAAIEGEYHEPSIMVIGGTYQRPSHCQECGHAYPWTERVINNAVELLSLDENISEEHKLIIKNAFPDLMVETPATPVAVAKYKTYVPKAAETVQNGLKNIFVDVVSEAVKKSIWG